MVSATACVRMTDTTPPRFALGLRVRLFLGMLTVTLVVTAGFALAMYEFVEVLEEELLHRTLARDLDGLVVDYRDGATITGQRGAGDIVFVHKPSEPLAALPRRLRSLPSGHTRVVQHAGGEFYVGRRDVGATRIYLMLSVATVEALERRLTTIAWLTFAGAVLAALVIAFVCARLILHPVRALADRVATLQPGQTQPPIAANYNDRTIHAIATSFDELVARFHAFLQRERAFTEDASHELRTPLAVTLSATELLLDDPDISTRTRERAERIHIAGQRMQRLVTALLFLAREQPQQRERCDIAAVVEDILPFYQERINHKQLTLNVDTRPAVTYVPPGMADCVLHNLIENAVEHTTNGGIAIYVAPQCIRISDTGAGIDAATLEHIFERRFHAPRSRGMGIGLYLVERVCTRLDWHIHAYSTPGEGSVFEIQLPPATPQPN